MDIEDTGVDIEILSEEGLVNQNGDPVDADFDVICTDDICVTDDVQNDDLPAGLLSALKKDAAEAAQAAASKKMLEGYTTAMDSFSVSSTAPFPSTTAMSTAHQTVPAANQTVPSANQKVPAANQTISAAHQIVHSANQVVSVKDQAVTTGHQAVTAEHKTVLAAHQVVPAAHQTVSAAHQAVSTAQQTVSAAHQAVSTAQQTVSTAPPLNSVAIPVDPVLNSSVSSADSTATVPNITAASTADSHPVLSCLPPQIPGSSPSKVLITNVSGGSDIKELILENNIPSDDEWSCVETELIVPGDGETGHKYTTQEAAVVKAEPVISFEEAFKYFKSADMSDIKPKIHQTVERRGFSAWTHYFFGPPKLRNNLLPSRELTFCMAATTFDNRNSVHVRSLLALYRNLTGAPNDCRRFGNHWETIGFQGNDPSTDLRGVGLFGLLQLLYLTSKPQLETLKKQIYALSNHNTQNFPFCVMSLNLSKLVLQTLREDKLNKLCNKREDLVSVVNDAFVATYYKVFHIWKNQNKTIVDSGFVLKEVENQLRKSPQILIKDLEEYLKNPNAAAAPKKKVSKSLDKLDDFVGIADILDK